MRRTCVPSASDYLYSNPRHSHQPWFSVPFPVSFLFRPVFCFFFHGGFKESFSEWTRPVSTRSAFSRASIVSTFLSQHFIFLVSLFFFHLPVTLVSCLHEHRLSIVSLCLHPCSLLFACLCTHIFFFPCILPNSENRFSVFFSFRFVSPFRTEEIACAFAIEKCRKQLSVFTKGEKNVRSFLWQKGKNRGKIWDVATNHAPFSLCNCSPHSCMCTSICNSCCSRLSLDTSCQSTKDGFFSLPSFFRCVTEHNHPLRTKSGFFFCPATRTHITTPQRKLETKPTSTTTH